MWPVQPMPGRFTVEGAQNNVQSIAESNAGRYSAALGFAEAVPMAPLVALYRRSYPLFQQAYEELGYPGRYFNDRLVGVLDQRLVDGHNLTDTPAQSFVLTEQGIRGDIANLLQRTVAGMSLDNFVVRPQRHWVEAWAQPEAWKRPTAEQLTEVAAHLSGLPTAVRDDDEDAKRFDALMLGVQLTSLRAEPALARLQARVQQLATSLLELASVPAVKNELLLIEAVAGDEWWQDVTLPMLEQARRKLRSLSP